MHDFDASGVYEADAGYNEPQLEPFRRPYEKVKENGKHSAEVFTDAALAFLGDYRNSEEAKAGRPFFLYLAHVAPHDPRQYPPRFRQRYTHDRVSLPANFAPAHAFDNGHLDCRDERLEEVPRLPDAVRQHIADYYAIISHVDEQVGRILDFLDETGLADETLIVFAGDNGLAVGQHGLMGKQNLYDHSLRVPLIFAGPGIPANQRTDAFCYLYDIFPTLCELAGIATPDTVEGRSLVPVLKAPDWRVREVMHFAYRGLQRAVRKENFKLIEYAVNGRRMTQLFDLAHDPLETTNLADCPEWVDTLAALREELMRWRTELGDTRPMGNRFWRTFEKG